MTFGESPPLTRELHYTILHYLYCFGITPAYAGTTDDPNPQNRTDQDHPRLRGNYPMRLLMPVLLWGSPPLTRELLICRFLSCCSSGITPAYAGTTPRFCIKGCRNRDHPRLRGNYLNDNGEPNYQLGSPPLTRELRNKIICNCVRSGITPAYAGTTSDFRIVHGHYRDHPRLRGNYRFEYFR